MTDFDIFSEGAAGDGRTNDAAAIQRAIDRCAAAGGGRVIIPTGRQVMCGTISLKSHVELHVERGATLLASPNVADYQTIAWPNLRKINTYPSLDESIAWITAYRAENVAVTGAGTIDGNGRAFVAERLPYIYRMVALRPFTFFWIGCTNISFVDVTIRDGAMWTVRLTGCDDVTIHRIHLLNDLMLPNNDGIDLDQCRNVRISDCHIVCGDDCICLKTCADVPGFGACENITVTGCTLVSTSSALIIGAEVHQPIRNVIFDACIVQASHRGLAIHLSYEADVENILFSNIIVETRLFDTAWWGRAEPIYLTALPWTSADRVGRIRNVRFSNILCRSENGVCVIGDTPDRIEHIIFDQVRVELDRWSKWPGGRLDLRPCAGEALPAHPISAFMLENATDITLRDCEVAWGSSSAEFHHALAAHQVAPLTLRDFNGSAAQPNLAAVVHDAHAPTESVQ